MGTHHLNADQLLAEWALSEFKCEPGTALVSVTFGHYVDCYSSWTHDYGVTGTFAFRRLDGTAYEVESHYGFPSVVESMAAYQEEWAAMEKEHDELHGDDEEVTP